MTILSSNYVGMMFVHCFQIPIKLHLSNLRFIDIESLSETSFCFILFIRLYLVFKNAFTFL